MVNGVDTSAFQEGVDWNAVRSAGYSFAYTKATEGTGYTSDCFDRDWPLIRASGMYRGAYHFHRFNADPIEQAKHFLSAYNPQSGDLPPMLDLEDATDNDPAQNVSDISKFLAVVEAAVKTRCVLYMGYYYWQGTLGSTDGFAGHPLWLAQYSDSPSLVPPVWKTWTFWQHTGNGAVNGIDGDVDLDYFNGPLTQLDTLKIKL